ncbi:UvrD-helicase domain-containing protein [Bacillus sp. UMB0728]|uniref:UvrD-helicase domain-containing protein n=1 Tax=Bacillus sp. UMB0728 TaxID=2066052 RepID=UPI000C789074|nr:ATP-dependent helicase [Bacillus sp. UMB0728]PLR71657.1 ATP-dependent DNA helicase Rep [Bacillus sp. UMB0728]
MKTAVYRQQTINIDNYSREEFQKIYDEGKKGNLFCPACGERVRMYLGIQASPHFYHLHSNAECQDAEETLNEVKKEPVEAEISAGGFRLPKSRTITAETMPPPVFQEASFVKTGAPFQSMPLKNKAASGYLKDLADNGFQLDAAQSAAVSHIDGPLLVLAGAGSGKTRVLTTRTAYMLQELRIDPKSIMLVTFTAKAAAEMKRRLIDYPGIKSAQAQQLLAGTFHSIFYRILSFHDREGWNSQKLLKKEWQREQILKGAAKELKIDEKDFAFDLALQKIGFWKNSLILPQDTKPATDWDKTVTELYRLYEEYKEIHRLFDFDDMLLGCYRLFQEHPHILESYQNRFHYFLIDEFQDINKVQYELIKMLSAKSNNFCAVGDDDQSIYAFRGSDPRYLLEFDKDFPAASIVVLDQNYRSAHEIVSAANSIIVKNKQRRDKKMKAQYSKARKPLLFFPLDEEEEATMIVTDIQEKISQGGSPGEFAVLFRTHAGMRAIFERLANSSLPFRIDQDAESFYDRYLVRTLLAFLKLALDEDSQESIKNILPALFLKQSVLQDLKAESILTDRTLLECLADVKTGFAFQEKKLARAVPSIRSIKSKSPAAAIDMIEKELGFNDFLKKRGLEGSSMEKGSDDIRDLKVAAHNFESIAEFLEHAEHMRAMNKEMKKPGNIRDNSITLSTIHRSKGLEYKTVYIIGAVDGSIPHDFALEAYRNGDPDPMEEERRLLYVAVTRAQEELFISVPQKRRGKKARPSRFLEPVRS